MPSSWAGRSKEAIIKPLAANGQYVTGKIADIQLLGFPGKLKWTQDTDGLKVELPTEKPCDYAYALKIAGLKLT